MKTFSIQLVFRILIGFFIGYALLSCNNNDDSKKKQKNMMQAGLLLGLSNTPPAPNLKITDIQTDSTANIGNTQTVKLKISSSYKIKDVPVTFVYMNKNDADKELAANSGTIDPKKIRSFLAGTFIIPEVSLGEKEYSLSVLVPGKDEVNTSSSEVLVDETYYLVPQMDIASILQKRVNHNASTLNPNNGQAQPSNIKTGLGYAYPVSLTSNKASTADLVVNSVLLNSDVLRYRTYPGSDPSIEGKVSLVSMVKDTLGAKVKFTLVAPDGTSQNMQVYDSDIPANVDTLVISQLKKNASLEMAIKLALTDSIKSFILPKINSQTVAEFKLITTILDKSGTEDAVDTNKPADGRTNNNKIESRLAIILDNGIVNRAETDADCYGTQQSITDNYISGGTKDAFTGSDWAGAGIKYTTSIEFKGNGIVQNTGASIPMSLATFRFDFVSYSGTVTVDPEDEDSKKYKYAFQFIGITLWSGDKKDLDEDMNIYQSYGPENSVWLGPVKLMVSVKAFGTIGIKFDISADSTFRANITPYFAIGGKADARMSVVVAGGGVRGSITFLDTKMLSQADGNVTYDSSTNRVNSGSKLYLGVEFTGVKGTVDAYVYVGIRETIWETEIDLTKEWTFNIVNFSSGTERIAIINQKANRTKLNN